MTMSRRKIAGIWNTMKFAARLSKPCSKTARHKAALLLSSEISFVPVHSRHLHGFLEINMLIANTTASEAEHPFLCLPAAGLPLFEEAGWACDRTRLETGQEMIQLRWNQAGSLLPGSESLVCILKFEVPRGCGPIVKIARGIYRRIDDASDLILPAVTGAANITADRFSHCIGMDSLRSQLYRQFPRMKLDRLPVVLVDVPLGAAA